MKKVLKYLLLIITLIVITTTSLTYVYKDKIIQHFIDEMNSKVNTPITVRNIDISLLDQLPYISVILNEVTVQESYKDSKESLLKSRQIACALNPLDLLMGDYTIQAIDIKDAVITARVDQYNNPNYLIFKKNEKDSAGAVFNLKTVRLINSTVNYENTCGNKQFSFQTENLKSSIQVYGRVYHIKSKGDARINDVLVNDQSYLTQIPLEVVTDLVYNQYQRTLEINPSTATYQNSLFDIAGNYSFEDNKLVLNLNCTQINLTTLKDLIPQRNLEKMKAYNYTGEAAFQLTINGKLTKAILPPSKLSFTLKNLEVIDPKHNTTLANAELIGYYQNSPGDSLALKSIKGDLNQKPFTSNVFITNFKDPAFDLAFDGTIDGRTLSSWTDLSQVDSMCGELAIDFTLIGKISDLKNKQTIPNVHTSGDISIRDFNISTTNTAYHLKQLNGDFIFNNNDLAISGFSGHVGESDFQLTGLIKNFLAYSMLDNQSLGIEADFNAKNINLDELLAGQEFDKNIDQSYHFAISPKLYLKLNCNIDHLQFRRFDARNLNGDLKVRHQSITTDLIKMNTMGGNIALSGVINAQSDSVLVTSSTDLSRINIDSLFYVFENFNQQFLIDNHLKGVVNAHIDNQASFDPSLRVNPNSIIADINTTIIDGELNDFEPMQKLAKYLDGDKLDRLRFAELTNEIHIENQTIYLPSMQVKSNVSNITIGGTHTFDQHIDYRVVAPFNNKNKVDKDAAFGSIETSETGKTKVFLKITGTTDNYDISYDKSAVKKEIISDLKREVQQLKDAFRKKGKKKKKEVELEEEDYFDWE